MTLWEKVNCICNKGFWIICCLQLRFLEVLKLLYMYKKNIKFLQCPHTLKKKSLKNKHKSQKWCLTPVNLSIQEEEIRKIAVQGQSTQKVSETPPQITAGHDGSCNSSQQHRKNR
jgi:hypothetical protein